MLSAVSLDDETRFETDEIGDVTINRHLTLELQAFQLLGAQELPEASLCRRRGRTEQLGEGAVLRRDWLAQMVDSMCIAEI